MSTISSRPTKRYSTMDFITVFVFFALLLTLLALPFTGNLYHSLSTALGNMGHSDASLASSVNYSFSADQQYWAENCSHGWSSDSTCQTIVSRTQSCSISADSAYCSEYESYLKQFSH